MKGTQGVHARLFARNDLVLDAEPFADVARELMAPKPETMPASSDMTPER